MLRLYAEQWMKQFWYQNLDNEEEKNTAKNFVASDSWLNDYMCRHEEFTICNQTPTEIHRMVAGRRVNRKNWFKLLNNLLKKLQKKYPNKKIMLYNYDEKGNKRIRNRKSRSNEFKLSVVKTTKKKGFIYDSSHLTYKVVH
jgi:hypothetical protein